MALLCRGFRIDKVHLSIYLYSLWSQTTNIERSHMEVRVSLEVVVKFAYYYNFNFDSVNDTLTN